MRNLFTAIILCLVLSAGCRHDGNDPRLVRIAELTETAPRQALEALDSIDPSELTGGDRHLFDLLTIKAKDKVYITHTSDSLILDVISYYDLHRDNPYYPEALYYGARVYSDLGDYPTSLTYFHRALDELPDDTKQLNLKCNILSQTGRLLNTLRLYKEAIPYVAKSVEVNAVLNDSINEVYDLQLLGAIHMRNKDYDTAEKYFTEALEKSQNLPERHAAKSKMYLAAVKFKKGELDSALQLIRHTPERVSPLSRNTVLAHAIKIYSAIGIMDTALIYAKALVGSDDKSNKQSGYQAILAPEVRNLVNRDSIDQYISDYRAILEGLLNDNQNQLALTQQAHYNYQLHEREKEKAQKSNNILQKFLVVAIALVVLLVIGILYFKNRNKNNIIRLQQALDNINVLKMQQGSVPDKLYTVTDNPEDSTAGALPNQENISLSIEKPTEGSLRERLKKELLSFSNMPKKSPAVPEEILQSEIYRMLRKKINGNESINAGEENEIWRELERVVTEVSPKFISNLTLLTSGKLSGIERQTTLLIKCGFMPGEMKILFSKSSGAIGSRRESLGNKIFGEKLGVNAIDNMIRNL